MADTHGPRVGIVGGGLAGLICARVLQRHGVTVRVLEAEASPDARPQGGTLDIHGDTGQRALALAGLTAQFDFWSRPEASATKMFDGSTGELMYAGIPGGAGWNPEIDRGDLRRLLLESLQPNSVSWGAKVTRIERNPDTTVDVHVANGDVQQFDLLIGADGAWSKVRPLLTTTKPRYTGITLVEGRIENWATSTPAAWSKIHPGSAFAVGKSGVIMVHSGRDAWVAAGLRLTDAWRHAQDWSDTAAAKTAVLSELRGWDPQVTALMRDTTTPLVARPMYTLPAGMKWRHTPGLTMIGDAAHLMPIFAGGGANLALLDGALLGEAIGSAGNAWHAAVHDAERALFKRTFKPVLLANLALNQYFGPSAARRVAYTFTTVQGGITTRFKRLSNLATSTAYTFAMYGIVQQVVALLNDQANSI